MRPLPPGPAVREYLDREIFQPVTAPPRRAPGRVVLGAAVAAVALIVGAMLASIALAQSPDDDSCIDPTVAALELICEPDERGDHRFEFRDARALRRRVALAAHEGFVASNGRAVDSHVRSSRAIA